MPLKDTPAANIKRGFFWTAGAAMFGLAAIFLLNEYAPDVSGEDGGGGDFASAAFTSPQLEAMGLSGGTVGGDSGGCGCGGC